MLHGAIFGLRAREVGREEADCGAACLAMVLRYLGRRVPLDELREMTGTGRDGVTALALLRVARRFGLTAQGVQCDVTGLRQLRRGVMIERGRRGEREGRVMTQPASITLVRDTDNPWYEVILTEGKNREIRKMFEEVGHFVEKVRRVGFGPLILDVKPGEMRELNEDEVTQLKRAARKKAPSQEQPQKPARRPRSGPATLPRPARKRTRRP